MQTYWKLPFCCRCCTLLPRPGSATYYEGFHFCTDVDWCIEQRRRLAAAVEWVDVSTDSW
jgi:hypothetical protein